MGESGDALCAAFAYNHEQAQEKKRRNKEWSTERLERMKIEFESKNDGVHLIIHFKYTGHSIDYWPSTGKFIERDTLAAGRGVRNLIKLIEGGYIARKVGRRKR